MTYPPQQPGPQQPDVPPPGQPYPQQPGAYPPPPGYPAPPPGYPVQPPGYPVPPQVAPKKGMGTGKILLLVFAGLVGLCCVGGIVAVAVSGGKSTTRSTGEKQAAAAATTDAAGTAVQAKPAHPKLGQPARDGKFEFTVQKVDCGKTKVGDDFLNKTAQGQFCLVTVTVKNIGNEPRTFSGGSQKASGAGGVKYTNDGAAEIYANKDSQTFLNDINPGNQVSGVLVFDIPQGAAIKSLELHDSLFSGGVTVDVS